MKKKTKSNSGLSTGATAGIVIAVLAIITIGLYSYYFKGGTKNTTLNWVPPSSASLTTTQLSGLNKDFLTKYGNFSGSSYTPGVGTGDTAAGKHLKSPHGAPLRYDQYRNPGSYVLSGSLDPARVKLPQEQSLSAIHRAQVGPTQYKSMLRGLNVAERD